MIPVKYFYALCVTLALAAAAMGRAPLALAPLFAELEAAQVLDGVRFSHDLVAEAAAAP